MRITRRSYRLGTALAVAALTGSLTVVNSAAASEGPVYPVMNTSEYAPDGVYFRNSSSWDDTSRISGWGIYAGDHLRLECWKNGSNVPRRDGGSNTLWYVATNESRPTAPDGRANRGSVNAHFVDDGTGPGEVAPGVPPCSETSTQEYAPSGGGSLYFSPYDGDEIKVYKKRWPFDRSFTMESVPSPATVTLDQGQWQPGCVAGNAVPRTDQLPNDKKITTLGGWSSGRNGPIMYLSAKPAGWEDVNFILLIDPGNKDAYYEGGCDGAYPNKSQLLAEWLKNPNNRLMVLAGENTADYAHPVNGYAHAGIQNKLFPSVRDAGDAVRQRVVVCNYDKMDHETVWKQFRSKLNDTDHTTCPGGPDAVWHP